MPLWTEEDSEDAQMLSTIDILLTEIEDAQRHWHLPCPPLGASAPFLQSILSDMEAIEKISADDNIENFFDPIVIYNLLYGSADLDELLMPSTEVIEQSDTFSNWTSVQADDIGTECFENAVAAGNPLQEISTKPKRRKPSTSEGMPASKRERSSTPSLQKANQATVRQKKKNEASTRYRNKKRQEKEMLFAKLEGLKQSNAELKAQEEELTQEVKFLRVLCDSLHINNTVQEEFSSRIF